MLYARDEELRQVFQERKALIKSNRKMYAQNQNSRFLDMTGMSIDEKMFQNMVSYYKTELTSVLKSDDESTTITKLPKKVRQILERNNIINHGWSKYELTPKARDYLLSNKNLED